MVKRCFKWKYVFDGEYIIQMANTMSKTHIQRLVGFYIYSTIISMRVFGFECGPRIRDRPPSATAHVWY